MPDNLDILLQQLNMVDTTRPQPDPVAEGRAPEGRAAHAPPAPKAKPKRQEPQDQGASSAGILGGADSVTFGFLDELGGVADTLGATSGRANIWNSRGSFSEILSGNIAKNRAVLKQAQTKHGGAFLTGQVVGAVAIPFGAGARGALQVAKVGAKQGAAYGVGSGEGVTDRAVKGAEGAAVGAVVGAALGKAVEKVGSGVRKLMGKGAKETPAPPQPEHTVEGWSEANLRGDRKPVITEKALDEASEAEEMVPLHAAPEEPTPGAAVAGKVDDSAPPGEPIGSISRAGLQDLQREVDTFRGRIASGGERVVDLQAEASQGAFRLGNLGDEPETTSLLGALVRQLPSKAGKTDAELMATAKAASDEMGAQDPEAVFALAQQIAGPLGDADTSMAVLRTVARRAASDIDAFHGAGIDWSTATDEMVQQVGSVIFNSQRLNSLLASAKVGVGRGLRTMQLPDADTYLQALVKGERVVEPSSERSIPPLPGTREDLQDFFDLWGMAKGNPEQQHDLLAGTLTVPTSSKYLQHSMANLFTASILSAPKTIALNLFGPALLNTVRALEKMSGGALGAINPLATPAERAASAEVAKAAPIALFHTLAEVRDVFAYGVQAFKANRPVLGGGGSVQDAAITFGPLNENLLRAAGADPDWKYGLGNLLNIFPRAFFRLNGGLDEMAKRFTYLNEVRVRAMVEAAGRGLDRDASHAFVREALTSSVDEAGAATDAALLRAAERTTLTGKVGAEDTFARWATDRVQTLRKNYPLSRFILPVFNVPANAIGGTLQRVPVLNRMPWMVEHAADLAGNNGVVAQAEAHGRTLLGASFLTGAYLLNQAGLLTGAGPQDNPTDAKIWRQTHEPYSIRVGDEWVSYRKLDILGGLLAIPATLSDVSVYHRADERSMAEAVLVGIASLAQWFRDQGAMRQATEFLSLGDNPLKDPAKTFERMFGQAAGGLIPASGFIRTMGVDTVDPYVRMKKDWTDYVKSGLPGLSQELEPLRNVLGEPVNRPANSLAEAVFPVTMAPVQTYAADPVLDELTRLYQVTGYGAGADPKALGYGFFDPQEVKLEDGRSLYFHAMQARATMKLDGMTLREALRELFDSGEYNQAVDADATQRETSQGDQSRGYLARSVFDRYNKAIKAEVAASSPLALKYLTAAAAKQRDDAYLRTVSVDDLASNPDLYRANGVDPTPYSDSITEGAAGDLLEALGR